MDGVDTLEKWITGFSNSFLFMRYKIKAFTNEKSMN